MLGEFVAEWGFGLTLSGPLMGFWTVAVWSAHAGLSRSVPLMGSRVSRSGPLLGFWTVTVFWTVPVWSVDCHGLVRSCGVLDCPGLVRS